MKKLFIFILVSLLSVSVFCEAFNLLPWSAKKDKIISDMVNNGWECSLNKNHYDFKPKNKKVTYCGENLMQLSLMFDSDDNLIVQNLFIDNNYDLTDGLMSILTQAVIDKAQFIDTTYKSEDTGKILTYIAKIDNYKALYMLIASSDKVIVGLTYSTVDNF